MPQGCRRNIAAPRVEHQFRSTEGVTWYKGRILAVSFAVSFSRHSVDLRVRCYDTDAQDLARTAKTLAGPLYRPLKDGVLPEPSL